MSTTQAMLLAIAPGVLLFVAGAVLLVSNTVRGGPSRSAYQVMVFGISLIPLGAAVWLVAATSQPVWVKLISVPPLILVAAFFIERSRHPPAGIDAR